MKAIRTIYFGTPSFSAEFLQSILSDPSLPLDIIGIVTQPDRPVGRKQILTPTPVKQIAEQFHIPVYDQEIKQLQLPSSWDLAIVFAYGEILSTSFLHQPRYGFLNVHPSLLPLYRGASPMVYPLMLGDKKTGVSLMMMDEKMDQGPIVAQEENTIEDYEERPHLEEKLTAQAFAMLKKLLAFFPQNSDIFRGRPQDHTKATYTHLLKKQDGFMAVETIKKCLARVPLHPEDLPVLVRDYLQKYEGRVSVPFDLNDSFRVLYNFFRGLTPWPGVWTTVKVEGQERRLKITAMDRENILRVQLEGKKEVDFERFNQYYRIF